MIYQVLIAEKITKTADHDICTNCHPHRYDVSGMRKGKIGKDSS